MVRDTEDTDFELVEQRHRKGFRQAMMFLLPTVAFAWMVLIAYATLTERISGLHVGIPLGVTGAVLLALLNRQISWAHSRKEPASSTPPATAILQAIRKLADGS